MAHLPAPSSDLALQSAPDFIRVGEPWDDQEWRAAAAKPAAIRTEAENYLWSGGPRPHPWGNAAVVRPMGDGSYAYFPGEAAYQAFSTRQSAQQQKPASVLAEINRGLAAPTTAGGGATQG